MVKNWGVWGSGKRPLLGNAGTPFQRFPCPPNCPCGTGTVLCRDNWTVVVMMVLPTWYCGVTLSQKGTRVMFTRQWWTPCPAVAEQNKAI